MSIYGFSISKNRVILVKWLPHQQNISIDNINAFMTMRLAICSTMWLAMTSSMPAGRGFAGFKTLFLGFMCLYLGSIPI